MGASSHGRKDVVDLILQHRADVFAKSKVLKRRLLSFTQSDHFFTVHDKRTAKLLWIMRFPSPMWRSA
jgi:hypothetical protein